MELVWIGTIKKNVTLSMPGYVYGSMHEYQKKSKDTPACTTKMGNTILWGKNWWASNESNKNILPTEGIKYIQNLVGKLIYYVREVDPAMLV